MTLNWTDDDVLHLIDELRLRGGDKYEVEVKTGRNGVPHLGETLSAFGNTPDGGVIVIGIDEKAGFSVTGISDVASYEQSIASQARDSITPPVNCSFSTVTLPADLSASTSSATESANKTVLIVHVQGLPLSDRPAYYAGSAYLRQADGDYELSVQEIAQLELLKTQAFQRTHPDRVFVDDSAIDDLDPDLLAVYLREVRIQSRRQAALTDEQILFNTGVTSRDGRASLAGLYALGIAPQRINPSLGITCAVQLDSIIDGARTQDLKHFTGPIPDLLEQSLEWVMRNTLTRISYTTAGHGQNQSELPMRAVREIIANALIHRNLDSVTDTKRIEIRIKNDSLIITSPGGLWGVSESQLGQPGGKSAVNPTLYEICKHLRMHDGNRVIEGEGGGIAETITAMQQAGLRSPHFKDQGIMFMAQLSRHALLTHEDLSRYENNLQVSPLSETAVKIIMSLRDGEEWSAPRIKEEFGVDAYQARSILKEIESMEDVTTKTVNRVKLYRAKNLVKGANTTKISADSAKAAVEITDGEKLEGERSEPLTKNGPAILDALDQLAAINKPATLQELIAVTGLSEGQTRFALSWLIERGYIQMLGKQGRRDTKYART
ncbi:ATP-binding protein [Corynebacterium sp. sy039]|uniref:ATP-binding protein n=1 Tax=Corynebacterium sp. sy039 TaxID=2599641 RepID=UPI0011B3D57A|nr:ATP-binding protein [Corynebacterium sp. sy039]QDZ43359.1 AAA family ATPase [Corynebacterium sp. sy039]